MGRLRNSKSLSLYSLPSAGPGPAGGMNSPAPHLLGHICQVPPQRMFPACSAAADQILPAEFLKFKEGRNFPLKKILQKESNTFQASGMYLFNICKTVRYRGPMERTKVWDYSAVFHSNLQGATILEQQAVAGTADGCFTLENDGTEKLCSRFGTEKTSSHPEG